MNPVHTSSEKMDWQTPEELLQTIREELGPIGLDPCSVSSNPTGATVCVAHDEGECGLEASWSLLAPHEHALVFVNPPYGREIGKWTQKCRDAPGPLRRVALVPSRTDTRWFRGAPYPAPFPSALLLWGVPRSEADFLASTLGGLLMEHV